MEPLNSLQYNSHVYSIHRSIFVPACFRESKAFWDSIQRGNSRYWQANTNSSSNSFSRKELKFIALDLCTDLLKTQYLSYHLETQFLFFHKHNLKCNQCQCLYFVQLQSINYSSSARIVHIKYKSQYLGYLTK